MRDGEATADCSQCGRPWEASACGPTHACLWQEIRCVEAVEALFYFKPNDEFVGPQAITLVMSYTAMDAERTERAITRWRAWRARRRAEVERADGPQR
jgi:hypothetical protein